MVDFLFSYQTVQKQYLITLTLMKNQKKQQEAVMLSDILKNLSINYDEICHPPVRTVAEAQQIKTQISGTGCKNLFLTDYKKQTFILVVLSENKSADLKKVSQIFQTSRLSFADKETLEKVLGVEPGCVSILNLVNIGDFKVQILIDRSLSGKRLLFHPNDNTKTISLDFDDMVRFIRYFGNDWQEF